MGKKMGYVSNDLINLLNSGSNGELPCPLWLNKMKELRLSYKRSRVMSRQEDAANDPKKAREEDIFGAIFSIGRMIYDIKEDRAKGKLKKTVTIDGCASCSSLWLDRGEIVQIKWNDVTLEYKGETVELAGDNAEPSPNVTTTHVNEEKNITNRS